MRLLGEVIPSLFLILIQYDFSHLFSTSLFICTHTTPLTNHICCCINQT
jgi:hypothetical protein